MTRTQRIAVIGAALLAVGLIGYGLGQSASYKDSLPTPTIHELITGETPIDPNNPGSFVVVPPKPHVDLPCEQPNSAYGPSGPCTSDQYPIG